MYVTESELNSQQQQTSIDDAVDSSETEKKDTSSVQVQKDENLDVAIVESQHAEIEKGMSSPQSPQPEEQGQHQSQLTLTSGSIGFCRICHTDSWIKEPLVSPCK